MPLKSHYLLFFLLLLLLVPGSGVSWAWHPVVHSWFVEAAFLALPPDFQAALEPYRESLVLGAQYPQHEDQPVHHWNVHASAEEQGNAPDHIQTLFMAILGARIENPQQAHALAFQLGLLAHAIADLSYPLHTDQYAGDEEPIQSAYDSDILLHLPEIARTWQEIPHQLWPSPRDQVLLSAQRANRFYFAVAEAYMGGKGYEALAGITGLCSRQAIQDIANVWMTIRAHQAPFAHHLLALASSQKEYRPGDILSVTFSAAPGRSSPPTGDLFIAFQDQHGNYGFLSPQGDLTGEGVSWRSSRSVSAVTTEGIVSVLVPPGLGAGGLSLYGLLVRPGGNPFVANDWISNLATLEIALLPAPSVVLADLKDETYLFHAVRPGSEEIVALPLRRWDFLFLGDLTDNPVTSENDAWTDPLIPGRYNHALVYLGRDAMGNPWGVEMTTHFLPGGADLRIVRLLEFEANPAGVDAFGLAVGPKEVGSYKARWAMRLTAAERAKIQAEENNLLRRIQEDWENRFRYQMEFAWSGNLFDPVIQLVDDGRRGGAGCTDYWLALYEDFAGICIHGSRITATELFDYFTQDPEGSQALVPARFNPFPFDLVMKQLLQLGFYPVDPPAHIFTCDHSTETGIPIPSLLMLSPQLEEIPPVPTPLEWQ